MPSKTEILKKYAQKHGVDESLISEIFELERAHLHPGEADKNYRQDEIAKLLRTRVEDEVEDD